MKLIKPAEISAKIMTLIDEAEKEVIIVSPYNKITGWTKLINRIKRAQNNNVNISWYTRENNVEKSNYDEVLSLGIEPYLVEDLHAKIYFNEEYAIFTSMNMSKYSDEKSIDLGYITESQKEYQDILHIFKLYIEKKAHRKFLTSEISSTEDTQNKRSEKHSKKTFSIKDLLASNNNYTHIDSNEYYIKEIHKHISEKYGCFDYNYIKDKHLEYYNFLKKGYKLQFVPYTQAVKINIYFPKDCLQIRIDDIYRKIRFEKKIYKSKELENSKEGEQNLIKYYFERQYKKVETWSSTETNAFLNNLDIIVSYIFQNS
jgi:hypothetical protein